MATGENNRERALIKILDEGTICRIAAGEVVVSGAYAIKEMIENSIDAGADEIVIDYSAGGLSAISISDNGCGMTRDDILMALEHHATSKLRAVSDLSKIKTYGFRGEALPSIAAVSRCEIISSVDSSLPAVSVKIEGGEIKSVQNAASTRGTKINIRNLFFNTPVRKKFLKSENYENALIIEFVTRYALAHPEIKFALYSSGREVFATRRNSTIEEVIASIFPQIISSNLIKIDKTVDLGEYGPLEVKILTAPPHITKPNARFQYYFINGRPFKNKTIGHAVYEAFQRYMPPRQHPVVFMFLNMAQRHVDVNVHPTKTEVAFACEFKIHDALKSLISEGLITSSVIPSNLKIGETPFYTQKSYFEKSSGEAGLENSPLPAGGEKENTGNLLFGREADFNGPGGPNSLDIQSSNFYVNRFSKERDAEFIAGAPAGGGETKSPDGQAEKNQFISEGEDFKPRLNIKKILGQSFDAFIVAEDDDGLLIIDQHVAAEKVFYEKILAALSGGSFHSQTLLVPHVYDLTVSEFEMLKKNYELFKKYGFDVEIFSNKSIAVRALPDFLEGVEEKNMVFEIISAGIEAGKTDENSFCDKIAARMACKAAIKAGRVINPETARMIINDLSACKNPYFCPHGRPIIIKLPLRDLLSRFKRSL
ncbi:MAG: DNA mismatch repair protein MutL [bacterium ADurb.Bin243]|nr:MAG: DNA mismatch repair protein MutL [bacterium ADurb.Bin243]HOD39132.1 DNA mismatch repair endonuclease MutL [Candidatus Wallbacteria bacterium]